MDNRFGRREANYDALRVQTIATPGEVDASVMLPWISVADYGATGNVTTDDTTAINNAWAALAAGGTLVFPPGTYAVSDTVNFKDKTNITVIGNNATIVTKASSNFANKTIVDMAGALYCSVTSLRIESTLTSNKPAAGLVLGRVDAGDGNSNYFEACWISGTYTYCSVYDVGAELTTFMHCRFHSTDAVPLYYTSSTDDANLVAQDTVSNVCKRFYSCTFAHYGSTAANVIESHGVTKELSFRDCYVAMPAGSHAIHLSGTSASCDGLIIDNMRVEGTNHANSRLLYDAQDTQLNNAQIGPFNWTIESDYVIDMASTAMIYSTIDMKSYLSGSTKMLRCNTVGNSYNFIRLRGSAMIYVETNAGFYANFLIAYSSGNPIAGYAYGADYHLRQDNIILRIYDTDTVAGIASRRVYGSELNTGTTPSVTGHDWFLLNYSGATTITNFTNPIDGQTLTLVAATGNATIANGTSIKLRGAVNWTMPAGSTLTLIYYAAGSAWYEVSRMDNVSQPTTGSGSASFTQGSGSAVNDASTFDGYTIAQVVKALRDLRLIA